MPDEPKPEPTCPPHGAHITTHEPDGSPEGGYWIVTRCARCMTELGRVHVVG